MSSNNRSLVLLVRNRSKPLECILSKSSVFIVPIEAFRTLEPRKYDNNIRFDTAYVSRPSEFAEANSFRLWARAALEAGVNTIALPDRHNHTSSYQMKSRLYHDRASADHLKDACTNISRLMFYREAKVFEGVRNGTDDVVTIPCVWQ